MKYPLLILLLAVDLYGYCQCNDKWRAGSAYSLDGKIYVLTVFISEEDWDYEEKSNLYESVYEAQDWIVAQAKRYKTTIKFKNGNFGLDKTIIYDDIPVGTGSGNEPVNLVSKTLKKIGYTNSMQFVDWVKENTDCTNSLVLILANKTGRGYAMQYSNEMDKDLYFLEGCLLYKEYEAGSGLLSSSIAHEFLHLFGAWDLYETFQQTKDREEKAWELFPDDIMLRISYDINELKIDKLTAWLTGLSSYKEDLFEWFRPKGY